MHQSRTFRKNFRFGMKGVRLVTNVPHTKRCYRKRVLASAIYGVCTFLAVVVGQIPSDIEPEFLAPLENHTVTQGREVYFTCVVNHLGGYKVAWIKSDSKAILAIHTHMVAHNSRLSVTHNGHNTWKLHVSNVQKNDSGTYMCQINTDPMRSQMGNLEVVVPPDIIDDDDLPNDSNTAVEGGSVRLRCHASGVPQPNVLWRREDNKNIIFRHDGGREKQALWSFDGESLHLSNIQRTDMGVYLCIASNGIPPSVSKRFSVQVHFHPVIKVSNQLVAAPIDSDVLIQCYVETSPRALNSWYRDSGEKLINGSKYTITEQHLNDYSLFLNLTIHSLEMKDYGGYICSSVNALGKAEGSIRLQELHLPSRATTTILSTKSDQKQRKVSQKYPVKNTHRKTHKPMTKTTVDDFIYAQTTKSVWTTNFINPQTISPIYEVSYPPVIESTSTRLIVDAFTILVLVGSPFIISIVCIFLTSDV